MLPLKVILRVESEDSRAINYGARSIYGVEYGDTVWPKSLSQQEAPSRLLI